MKDFNYYAPKTVKEAVSTLAKLKGDGKIMCGGQSMLLLMKQNMLTPENVVDIKGQRRRRERCFTEGHKGFFSKGLFNR